MISEKRKIALTDILISVKFFQKQSSVAGQLDRLSQRKGMSPAGGVAASRMAEESGKVIFEYTDTQAIEDGVLVEVSCGAVNRVTCAVFDHFARLLGNLPDGRVQFDITPLTATIRAVLGVTPDEDGWRKSTYEGKELWLVPNEVQGLTLMFPDDY